LRKPAVLTAFAVEPSYSYQKANLHFGSLKQARTETVQE